MKTETLMAEVMNFAKPIEVRKFQHGRIELVKIKGYTIGRAYFEPGWKWSNDVKPIAKTHSCEAAHFQYQLSGQMRVRMDDGTEFTTKAGDVSNIPAGHDAWVIGNETVIAVDFQGMVDYAKPKEHTQNQKKNLK
jgi:hypothetical protein